MIIYRLWQCTWGCLQTILGLILFLINIKNEHFSYHGSIVTKWKAKSSVSLGMFIFITDEPYFADKFKGELTNDDLFNRLLVHEYGHTVQSLIFGPLYLIIMGIPSTLWGFIPSLARKRRDRQLSYFSFFTEKSANRLGERITKEKSMEELVID